MRARRGRRFGHDIRERRTDMAIDERKYEQALPYRPDTVKKLFLAEDAVRRYGFRKAEVRALTKKLEGIAGLRDESDKDGMRMVIDLKRGEVAEVVLNNLFQQTQMQNVFGINIVALVDGQPRTLNLKQLLEYFLRHRREVVTRRTLFDLRKARERAHLLEGLAVALANKPRLLLMDEPTAGMGPAEAQNLMELTKDIVRTRNIGVLFTEHDMDVVFNHADRIIVLNRGELVAEGTPAEVQTNEQVKEIYLGGGEAAAPAKEESQQTNL